MASLLDTLQLKSYSVSFAYLYFRVCLLFHVSLQTRYIDLRAAKDDITIH